MCEQCSNPNHEFDNVQQLTAEEMQGVFSQTNQEPQMGKDEMIILFPPVEFDDEQLLEDIESDAYLDGKDIGLRYVGIYETLINHGCPVADAVTLCLNEQTLHYNYEMQKLNVEISKNQVIVAEKGQL